MKQEPTLSIPYPGLRPFDHPDAPVFFGRADQTAELLNKLEVNRFVAVVGSSGSGKSSLVRAGLRPALERGLLFGIEDMRFAVMKPHHSPFRALAESLAALIPEQPVPLIAAHLRTSGGGLGPALKELGLDGDFHIMVVIDQFEELFGFRRAGSGETVTQEEASAFVSMLLATAGHAVPAMDDQHDGMFPDTSSRIWVVLTMRSDFIGDCEAFLGLPEAVSQSQFLVPRLNRCQMIEAISGPGTVVSQGFAPFRLDPLLVARMISDAGDRMDQLPLLQHALLRTWKVATADPTGTSPQVPVLTLAHYLGRETGGMTEALSRDADAALAEFLEEGGSEEIVRHLFMQLCEPGPDGQLLRRRPTAGEVALVAGCSLEVLGRAVHCFQREDRNFLTVHPSQNFKAGIALPPDSILDISHEALLRQWERMQPRSQRGMEEGPVKNSSQGWVAREAAARKGLLRLKEEFLFRDERGRPVLLEGAVLARALEWQSSCPLNPPWAARYLRNDGSEETPLPLSSLVGFLDRSHRRSAWKARTRRAWRITVATVLVGAAGFCGWAWWRASQAQQNTEAEIVRGCAESIGRGGSDFESPDVEALWRLASTPNSLKHVRFKFLERLYAGEMTEGKQMDIGELGRLQQWEPQLFHAAAGLQEKNAITFRDSQAPLLASHLVTAMRQDHDPLELSTLGLSLANLGNNLPGRTSPALLKGAGLLAAAMNAPQKNIRELQSLASTLAAMGGNLASDKKLMVDAATNLLNALKSTKDPDSMSTLAFSLATLSGHLPAESRNIPQEAIGLLLAAMEDLARKDQSLVNPSDLSRLADSLVALWSPVDTDVPLYRAARSLVSNWGQPGISDEWNVGFYLDRTLQNIVENLSGGPETYLVAEEIRRLLEPNTVSPVKLRVLREALGLLAPKLTSSGGLALLEAAAGRMVDDMGDEQDPNKLRGFISSLAAICGPLPAPSKNPLRKTAHRLNTLIQNQKDATPGQIQQWSELISQWSVFLTVLIEKLPPEDRTPYFGAALELQHRILEEKDPGNLQRLAAAQSGLAGLLPDEQRKPLLETMNNLLAKLELEKEEKNRDGFATALVSVIRNANPDDTAMIGRRLVQLVSERAVIRKDLNSGDRAKSVQPATVPEDARSSATETRIARILGEIILRSRPEPEAVLIVCRTLTASVSATKGIGKNPDAHLLTQVIAASDKEAFFPDEKGRTPVRMELIKNTLAYTLGEISPDPFPRENNVNSLEDYGKMIAILEKDDLVEALKYPFSVLELRQLLLGALEQKLASAGTPHSFKGDIWDFIENAGALGLNVQAPPVRPDSEKLLRDLESLQLQWKQRTPSQ